MNTRKIDFLQLGNPKVVFPYVLLLIYGALMNELLADKDIVHN